MPWRSPIYTFIFFLPASVTYNANLLCQGQVLINYYNLLASSRQSIVFFNRGPNRLVWFIGLPLEISFRINLLNRNMSTYVVFLKVKVACSRLSDRGEGAKENGTRKVVFALSQFSRSDYLGAWNRLRSRQSWCPSELIINFHSFYLIINSTRSSNKSLP